MDKSWPATPGCAGMIRHSDVLTAARRREGAAAAVSFRIMMRDRVTARSSRMAANMFCIGPGSS